MPSIPKGNRKTFAVKARSTFVKDKEKAFAGMDKSNTHIYNSRQWRKLRQMVLHKKPICVRKHTRSDPRKTRSDPL